MSNKEFGNSHQPTIVVIGPFQNSSLAEKEKIHDHKMEMKRFFQLSVDTKRGCNLLSLEYDPLNV